MFHLPHMSFILFYFILGWGGGGGVPMVARKWGKKIWGEIKK